MGLSLELDELGRVPTKKIWSEARSPGDKLFNLILLRGEPAADSSGNRAEHLGILGDAYECLSRLDKRAFTRDVGRAENLDTACALQFAGVLSRLRCRYVGPQCPSERIG